VVRSPRRGGATGPTGRGEPGAWRCSGTARRSPRRGARPARRLARARSRPPPGPAAPGPLERAPSPAPGRRMRPARARLPRRGRCPAPLHPPPAGRWRRGRRRSTPPGWCRGGGRPGRRGLRHGRGWASPGRPGRDRAAPRPAVTPAGRTGRPRSGPTDSWRRPPALRGSVRCRCRPGRGRPSHRGGWVADRPTDGRGPRCREGGSPRRRTSCASVRPRPRHPGRLRTSDRTSGGRPPRPSPSHHATSRPRARRGGALPVRAAALRARRARRPRRPSCSSA
jgi:hypothetical protein